MNGKLLALLISPIIILFPNFSFSQSPQEKEIEKLVQEKQFEEAIAQLKTLIDRDSNNVYALFESANVLYKQEQRLKQQERREFKFKNFQNYFDQLYRAYNFAVRAAELFPALSEDRQKTVRLLASVSPDQITKLLQEEIIAEAYDLIKGAPYRKKTADLYRSGIYDRVKDADELLVLREALLDQCGDFIDKFPNNRYTQQVITYRKELLAEYITIDELRQYGDRSGEMYEKYCQSIIQLYSSNELKHIVPRFYGAEYGFGESSYRLNTNYSKLRAMAQSRQQEVIELLCELNLHYEGFSPEKESLYDTFIRKMAPEDVAWIAVQKQAAFFVQKSDWKGAAEIYQRYQSLFPKIQERFKKTIALLKAPLEARRLDNLGKGVNSLTNDYNPVMTTNGNTLYFARKNADTGEDILVSKRKGKSWSKATPLGSNINTRSHEVPVSVSADGNTLIIFGNYHILGDYSYILQSERRLGKGDIYYSRKTANGWGKVQVFKFPVNTLHYETGLTLTADDQAVIFASDRPSAMGGYNPNYPKGKLYYHGSGEFNLDLYVCERTEKGWGEPINLGEVINTPFAEKNPYLHPDMETLYFSSDGHYGLGGYDIFVSKRLNKDSWTEWSEPVNIGKTINSPTDDTFYLTSTGKYALMVSSQEGNTYGKSDIYMVVVPEKHRPVPTSIISGKITAEDGKGLGTKVVWEEEGGQGEKGLVETDPKSGEYQLFLKNGKKYVYYAQNANYFGNSGTVDLTEANEKVVQEQESIHLSSIDPTNPNREPIILKTLHFDHNSDVIRPESYFDLERLVKILRKHQLKIRIEGHTDSDGNDAFNLDLSQRRSASVKRYLSERGVGQYITQAEGFGESRPIATNETEEGKQLNRRVAFIIVGKGD